MPAAPVEGMPRRVLHVVRQYAPAIGGLETFVRAMVAHQRALGVECTVLTLDRIFHSDAPRLPARETIDGAEVIRVRHLGPRRLFLPLFDPRLLKRFDIVHVHNTDGFMDVIGAIAPRLGVPAVMTTHGGFFHTEDNSRIKRAYFDHVTRRTIRGFSRVYAISGNDERIFAPIADDVELVPNAVAPLGEAISEGTDFLSLGRLSANKRVDRLVRVFGALHRIAPESRLHVVGPPWDVTIETLRAIAREEGCEDAVTFHGGVEQDEIGPIAMRCGTFLSASEFEGFGLSMVEAMSVGLVPYVEGNASFRELVGEAGIGAIVDYSEPEAAARRILEGNRSVDEGTRRRAREFALGYSWEALARRTLESYAEVIAERGGARSPS